MVKTKRNSKGFGVVEIILVVAFVAALGLVGWYAFKATNKTDDTPKQETSSSDRNSNAEQPQQDTKYLDIPEWNVRLPLDSDIIAEATYSVSEGSTNKVGKVDLTTPKVSNTMCNEGRAMSNAGSLYRSLSTEELGIATNSDPQTTDYQKVGDYYYFYWSGSGYGNCHLSTEALELMRSTEAAFRTAGKGLIAR